MHNSGHANFWLPHEHQLRELLGAIFRCLVRSDDGFRVHFRVNDELEIAEAATASDAYAGAVVSLVLAAR